MKFRFRNFKVYQEAKMLHREVVKKVKKFPREHYYLSQQLLRSSLSPVLNIAEGSAKRSDKDFNRYLENAMGSVNETVAALEIAVELKLITDKEFRELEEQHGNLVNQLGGFSKKLMSS